MSIASPLRSTGVYGTKPRQTVSKRHAGSRLPELAIHIKDVIKACILSNAHGRFEALGKRAIGIGTLGGLVVPAQNLMIAGRRGLLNAEVSHAVGGGKPPSREL